LKIYPAIDDELPLKSHAGYFDSIFLKTEHSVLYLSEEFLLSSISNLKHFIALYLSTALPDVITVSAFLLMFPAASASIELSFSSLKGVNT
jgi:hypothetical protein